jgi:hypothetical protein
VRRRRVCDHRLRRSRRDRRHERQWWRGRNLESQRRFDGWELECRRSGRFGRKLEFRRSLEHRWNVEYRGSLGLWRERSRR